MERQAAGVGKPVELAAAPAPIHIICSNNHLQFYSSIQTKSTLVSALAARVTAYMC
jgi:hypothetical protein